MALRRTLRSPQLLAAGIGGVLVAGAAGGIATGWEQTAGGEVVLEFEVLFYAIALWVGFPVLAMGLSIQRERGPGIEFEPLQRRLLVASGIAWGASPVVAAPLSSTPKTAVVVSAVTAGIAVVAFAVAVGWRVFQGIRE